MVFSEPKTHTPFLDAAVTYLEPVLTSGVEVLQRIQPDIWWTVSYLLMLAVAYLFHSPFRTHTGTDTYARTMKVMQTWMLVVIIIFHLAPRVALEKQRQLELETDATFSASIVFFPVFFSMTLLFIYIHKMKRKWHLGVTYGPNFSSVMLNSIVLAIFATVHYAYCLQLFGSTASGNNAVEWVRFFVATPPVMHHPFQVIFKLLYMCIIFLCCDYKYKSLWGFDPTRGILWSEWYDLKKDNDEQSELNTNNSNGASSAQTVVDWRELEAPPKSFKKRGINNNSIAAGPTATAAGVSSSLLPMPVSYEGPMDRRNSRDGYESTSSAAKRADSFNFRESKKEIQEVLAANHPVNKPGMVPWWSTFIFATAWQAFAGATLKFLSFDVRSLLGMSTPKVFVLSYSSKLATEDGNSNSLCEERSGMAATSATSGSPNTTGGTPFMSGQCSPFDEAVPSTAGGTDVWFDWIADVGDGFNPTYEMARLMAQPSLKLHDLGQRSHTSSSSSKQQQPVSAVADNDVLSSSMNIPTTQRRLSTGEHPTFLNNFSESQTATGVVTHLRTASTWDNDSFYSESKKSLLARTHSRSAARFSALGGSTELPRGSFVLIGGDLAYPNPCDETYQSRLFEPYRDALRGNRELRKIFHERQRSIVVQDTQDADMAHISMLDAATVANIAQGGDSLRNARGSVEEALRSIPLLFAIPGNHDWFDGLSTFRKFIIEKTWIGGWLMPQRSSFFVLKLPHNWFILCGDTGNEQDIDVAQRNYFLGVIEKYMDESSCVILTCHEPGWLFNAMEQREKPLQPQVDRIVRQLGARLRLRIAGDIHYYSRHAPVDPISEAATLIVSGGGGGYLYGARDDPVISQGAKYKRHGAFPQSNTYMSIATRLWGFRVINWKFDLVIGFLCFGVIFSLLPLPTAVFAGSIEDFAELISVWVGMSMELVVRLCSEGVGSFIAVFIFFLLFSSAGSDRHAAAWWRAVYGGMWTAAVVFTSCTVLSFLFAQLAYMAHKGMILSTEEKWASALEDHVRYTADSFLNHTRSLLGESSRPASAIEAFQHAMYGGKLVQVIGLVSRSLDPVETLYHLASRISSPTATQFDAHATRVEVMSYYVVVLFFYWILVTPLVSFIFGLFLFVSVTVFDYMYDGAYSAFQIEDFKHFLRFRIDATTRELHGYAIGETHVPKNWNLDPRHAAELNSAEGRMPPHLRRYPSRWRPLWRRFSDGSPSEAEVLEHFVVYPHRCEGGLGAKTRSFRRKRSV